MPSKRRSKMGTLLLLVSGMPLLMPPTMHAQAQSHVVTRDDLRKDVAAASRTRGANLAKLQGLMSSNAGKKALESTGISERFVQKAVSALGDADLARLAARAEGAQKDFAAGALTNQELTYIIIALATAVIIIVIVVA